MLLPCTSIVFLESVRYLHSIPTKPSPPLRESCFTTDSTKCLSALQQQLPPFLRHQQFANLWRHLCTKLWCDFGDDIDVSKWHVWSFNYINKFCHLKCHCMGCLDLVVQSIRYTSVKPQHMEVRNHICSKSASHCTIINDDSSLILSCGNA